MSQEIKKIGIPQHVKTYNKDGRWPIEDIYAGLEKLLGHGWKAEIIATQQDALENGQTLEWPIIAFISRKIDKPTESFWALGGIHGEEPAPPMAFAQEVDSLVKLADSGILVVALPFLNPSGYWRDWRYPNERRDYHIGQSVTDSEDYLSLFREPVQPKTQQTSGIAKKIIGWVIEHMHTYLPRLVIDHHEDELEKNPQFSDPQQFSSYLYFYGKEENMPIAHEIVNVLRQFKMPISDTQRTRFGEAIVNGVVHASADGSVDELFAAPAFVQNGVVFPKYQSPAVIVVETTRAWDDSIPLAHRVHAQRQVMTRYSSLWRQLDELELTNRETT